MCVKIFWEALPPKPTAKGLSPLEPLLFWLHNHLLRSKRGSAWSDADGFRSLPAKHVDHQGTGASRVTQGVTLTIIRVQGPNLSYDPPGGVRGSAPSLKSLTQLRILQQIRLFQGLLQKRQVGSGQLAQGQAHIRVHFAHKTKGGFYRNGVCFHK